MTKTEFQREERYVVFKVSDLGNSLKGDEIRRLAREYAEQRRLKGKEPLECVVVEKDWPEYDLVWDMIESRMTKGQNRPEDDSLIEDIKLCMDMADGGEDSDSEEAAFFASILARIRRLEGEKKLLKEKLAAGAGVPREAIQKMLTQLMDIAVSNGANSVSMPDEYVEVAAWLCGIPAQPAPSVPDGWKEAAIAWEVCASIHREYGKGKDPFFNTRQGDFVKHANDARAMLAAAPEAKP